jgi:hypothetical protein
MVVTIERALSIQGVGARMQNCVESWRQSKGHPLIGEKRRLEKSAGDIA